ncbi:MAG: hypothetical protein PSV13_15650 [Lacunisphaera sp.]|nr:hypothetical protein [Lacunisphaera sp.]
MKSLRPSLFAAFAAVLLLGAANLRAAETPAPAAADSRLYVTIGYSDPIRFNQMRWARSSGEDLIIPTLKSSAAEQARFAGYVGEIIVLDEKTQAPDGATVLNLAWNDGAVTADVTQAGKNKYLGVVNRQPLTDHPDFARLRRSIDTAGLPEARRDAAARAELQMELYLALRYLVHHQKTTAPGR